MILESPHRTRDEAERLTWLELEQELRECASRCRYHWRNACHQVDAIEAQDDEDGLDAARELRGQWAALFREAWKEIEEVEGI